MGVPPMGFHSTYREDHGQDAHATELGPASLTAHVEGNIAGERGVFVGSLLKIGAAFVERTLGVIH